MHGVENWHAPGGAIDPIEYEAVQLDVEIGGGAESLDERDAPVGAAVRWSPACGSEMWQ
jgi:hypothetical protein